MNSAKTSARPCPTPTLLLIRGVVYIVANDLHEERRLRPLARAVSEMLELDQAEPEGLRWA